MRNPQPKNFTWLFLATYADSRALPVVLRTQANTEDEARSQLSGDFSLTFAAKIRSDCPHSQFDLHIQSKKCEPFTLCVHSRCAGFTLRQRGRLLC
ncbi:host cell division inhibitor Icd-like protein [Klebsiella quasipneumoniae subsp. quasipneumoniae]|uniref:host cell division inhibitor Icd-like protein n=1 Tax=Klebsiella quasipneumoniae TaxID=1463165 RepID=UPI002F9698DF